LFIGNLSLTTTGNSLRSGFEEVGKVIDAIVERDRESGHSLGFGFVTFDDCYKAMDAISRYNGLDFEGSQIRVEFASEHSSPIGIRRG
ncbi:hypothetical protein BGW38_007621, partial [Lunasporangiospora selenospora]